MKWKVVPLCEAQRQDVRAEDIMNGGLFRVCDLNRAGYGYDKFPEICEKRFGTYLKDQFVVQLYGCVLDCSYCYVTKYGIWGGYVELESADIIKSFSSSNCRVFHLMGGSPALYMEDWIDLIQKMESGCGDIGKPIFHSDMLLVEKEYDLEILKELSRHDTLIAINMKGCSQKGIELITRRKFNYSLFYKNLEKVIASGLNFYLTITSSDAKSCDKIKENFSNFFGDKIVEDMFRIDIIPYGSIVYNHPVS